MMERWGVMAWQAGMVFTLRSLELWSEPLDAAPRLMSHLAEKQRDTLAFARSACSHDASTYACSRCRYGYALLPPAPALAMIRMISLAQASLCKVCIRSRVCSRIYVQLHACVCA